LRLEIAHASRVSMIGHLASALAHEINQPLGAILRNAEAAELFMQNESPDLDEIRAILADIRKEAQRAGTVIDRIRSQLRHQEIEMRSLDVAELVYDIVALTRTDARVRHVTLEIDVPAALPSVCGDRVQIQQVLLNLIRNGMDALDGLPDGQRCVTVRATREGADVIEISVSDTGHGIPSDKVEKIFEPFFTTKTQGMGIGLAISRTIIETHGGRLWAENNEGRGATFRFTLKNAEEVFTTGSFGIRDQQSKNGKRTRTTLPHRTGNGSLNSLDLI
jgi:signal transduction histidine kinase